MIKSSSLTSLLKKVINNGIETVFISRISGEILCVEGKESNQTLSDIISSMWIEYCQISEASSLKDEKLNYLLIENEDSYIITTDLYNCYIVCMKSNKNIKLGMLKKHLEGLTQNLNKMLEPFKDIISKKEDEANNENK